MKTKKLPQTHEECMKVIRNETQSASTKNCLECIKEAKKSPNFDKALKANCAKLCGFH